MANWYAKSEPVGIQPITADDLNAPYPKQNGLTPPAAPAEAPSDWYTMSEPVEIKEPKIEPKSRTWGQYAGDLAENAPRRFVQGATFGFGDEISSALGATAASAIRGEKWGDAYDKQLSFQRAKIQEAKQENPYVGAVAEIGGAIGPGIAAIPQSALRWAGSGGRLASTLKGAAIGAPVAGASGAVYGYGTGEGGAKQRLDEAASMGATSALAGAALPIGFGVLSAAAPYVGKVVSPITHPYKTIKGAYNLLNNITDSVASGVGKNLRIADLGDDIVKNVVTGKPRPMAEVLFLKTLQDEGISIDDALYALNEAQKYGATPSIAATSSIPQMKTQAHLLTHGSAGSSVAEKAISDISESQIPSLNTKAIKAATGGDRLGAAKYGENVAAQAKELVDQKIKMLQTRAKPFYTQAVGVDKSIPIEVPQMQKALSNPLVVKALEESRVDPYTLTNVKKELADFGVNAVDLEKLPYNSTVSLHAARTHLRGLSDAAFRAGEKQKGKAIKEALSSIDDAIESTYPPYKTARRIYSEDAGALKLLKESPVGKMATFADGDYSKIANDLMTKDATYIKKFVGNIKDSKMKDSLAGAYLSRKLEESGGDALRFSQSVFRSEGSSDRLRALVGDARFEQLKKIDSITDLLLETKNMKSGSITSPSMALRGGDEFPKDISGIIGMVKNKIAPDLLELIRRDPTQSKAYIRLLLTDDGRKLLESVSAGKRALASDVEKVGKFFNKTKDKLFTGAK